MDYIRREEISRYVNDAIGREITQKISWYSIGLISVKKSTLEQKFIGSGTLIEIEGIYGILTARHVTDLLKKDISKLGIIMSDRIHVYEIDIEYLKIIDNEYKNNAKNYPDISAIIIPKELTGTLKSTKLFYSISQKRTDILQNPLDTDVGIWVICGFPDEYTTVIEETIRGYDFTKGFCGLCIGSKVEKEYTYENYDFVELGINYQGNEIPPTSFGGVSGGGLWQVPLWRSENNETRLTFPSADFSLYPCGFLNHAS